MFKLMRPLGRFLKSNSLNKRQPLRRKLTLESLEGREVPANLITTVQAGTTLTITGQDKTAMAEVLAGDNDQVVIITGTAANTFAVDVGGSTLFGSTNTAVTQNFSNISTIVLKMGLGNDVVTINNLNLTGDLKYDGGAGDNTLTIGGVAGTTLKTLTAVNGDGNDVVTIGNGTVQVNGPVSINNGVGNSQVTIGTVLTDSVTFGTAKVAGNLTIKNGDGFDALIVGGDKFTVNGATSIDNGNGNTLTKIASSTVTLTGNTTINANEGFDQIVLGLNDGVTVGTLTTKGITIATKSGGSDITLDGAINVTGTVSVTNTDGSDNIAIGTQVTSTYTQTGSVTINTGNGGSDVSFGAGTVKITNGSVTLTNGAGLDNFTLGGTDFTITGTPSGLTINNGTGGSFVSLTPSNSLTISGDVKVTNAAGADTTLLGAAGSTNVSTKGFAVTNGSGGSFVQVSGTKVAVGGAFTVTSTDGEDDVSIDAATFTVSSLGVSLKSGAGSAQVQVNSATAFTDAGAFAVENGSGDLTLLYGAAGASLTSKGLSWKNGAGTVGVTVDGSVTVNGNLTGTGGEGLDTLTFANDLLVTGNLGIGNGTGGSSTSFNGVTKVAGTFTLTNADGDDQFTAAGTSFSVGGVAKIDNGLGSGTTSSDTKFTATTNTFTAGVTVKAGAGADSVRFSNTTTAKGITIDLGNDAADIEFTGDTTVTAGLTVTTGDGADTFNADHKLDVTGATKITTGTGGDTINWGASGFTSTLTGAVTILTGTTAGDGEDSVTIFGWTANGTTKIDTGLSNDVVTIDNSAFNSDFTLLTGGGSDGVFIETQNLGGSTTFAAGKKASISLGDGDDTLDIGIVGDATNFVAFGGTTSFKGDAGLDQIHYLTAGGRFNTFVGGLEASAADATLEVKD